MTIRVTCQSCRAAFTARDELAGKRGKCPKCQAAIQVPQPASSKLSTTPEKTTAAAMPPPIQKPSPSRNPQPFVTPPQSRPVTPAAPQAPASDRGHLETELLAGFRADIEPVDVPLLYRVGILLVAIVMILLPLAYLAVIGLTGLGVYYHVTHHAGMLELGSGRGKLFVVLAYLAPVVAGAILVLFMLKPLFARQANAGRTRSLTRQGEPLLFAFVDRVCQAVGSPPPARIRVDCQLNASASFEGSPLGNRLVLTIGAPLVAGIEMAQMAGILAHEFGHFTQGAGMRLTYVVRSINAWFARLVYQRDAWDQWLEQSANSWDFRVGWVLQLSRLCVWLSRAILWLFMMSAHAISSFMMRQMEFHADAHEARLVGAEVFESTTRRLAVLSVAFQGAVQGLGHFVEQGELPDDLPQLVLIALERAPSTVLETAAEHRLTAKTQWHETHPSDRERIARAHAEGHEAALRVKRQAAAALFTDFKSVVRGTTWDLYRALYGSRFPPSMMHPTEKVLAIAESTPYDSQIPIPID